MIKNKEKLNPAAICMLAIFMISFLSIAYQIALKNIVVDVMGVKADWIDRTITSLEGKSVYSPQSLDIDWSTIYPFGDPSYNQNKVTTAAGSSSEATDKLDRIFTQFEKYCSDWYMFTGSCEIVSKGFSHLLGMNLISDSYGSLVFQQQDGRFMAERPYKDVSVEAGNVASFSNYLKTKGITYLYVAVPSPVDPYTDEHKASEGYLEYSNVMEDELLCAIRENNVNYVDLRASLHEMGISWTDVFYKTDHHWKPAYGLWAAGMIAEQIDELKGSKADRDIFDINNYDISVTEDIYMGGYGQSVTSIYTDKDDMEVWTPKYDTEFEKTIPSLGLTLNGSFEQVMYDDTVWPSYNIWNHGITAVKTYRNRSKTAEKLKILCLTESYSDVVIPFLSSAYTEVDELDLRIFNGSVEAYIEAFQPDIVVTIYSAYDLNNGGATVLYEFQ